MAGLPRKIAEREWQRVASSLSWPDDCLDVRELPRNRGSGNVISLMLESDSVTEVFTAFGRKEASSEKVADEAIAQVRDYLKADVPVGEHLADQLLLPLTLAGRGSFHTLPLSSHALTNIDVIREFVDVPIEVSDCGSAQRVTIGEPEGVSPRDCG